MPSLDRWLVAVGIACLLIGICLICLSRASSPNALRLFARCFYVLTIAFLALNGILAAIHHAEALSFIGLTTGGLVIGMLWDHTPNITTYK